jgi:hypothetical protein
MAPQDGSTQAAPDFRELLHNTTSENVERPRSLPKGHYVGAIINHSIDFSKNKKTPYVRFFLKVDGPGPDVSASDVDGIDFSRRELHVDQYITPKSMWRLTDCVDAVIGRDGRPIDERLPEMDGQRVLIEVVPQVDQEGKDTGYNEVKSIVKAS